MAAAVLREEAEVFQRLAQAAETVLQVHNYMESVVIFYSLCHFSSLKEDKAKLSMVTK